MNEDQCHIVAAGDVMLARWVATRAKSNWKELFDAIHTIFKNTDIALFNLESPLKNNKYQTLENKMVFAGDPNAAEALKLSKINIASLANNHIADQGDQGFQETRSILNRNNILTFGAGENEEDANKPLTVRCNNFKIGFIADSYGLNQNSANLNVSSVKNISQRASEVRSTVDYLIVYAHRGKEYSNEPTEKQYEQYHAFIDAGVDLVVGSHPHALQPIEIYKNRVIAYSLGNLVFDQSSRGKTTRGALLKLLLTRTSQSFEIIPISIKDYFKPEIEKDYDLHLKEMNISKLHWQLPL